MLSPLLSTEKTMQLETEVGIKVCLREV
jgi:hypothetical protein